MKDSERQAVEALLAEDPYGQRGIKGLALEIADTIERLAEIADAAEDYRKVQIDQQGSVLTKYDTMKRIQAEATMDAALAKRR